MTDAYRLINLAVPSPGVRFKKSAMPFVQMENISHFLRACEQPPLHMAAHDRFLTVDLYEAKDPAQVLQCLGAFSRVAHAQNPARFPTTIGPKRGGGNGNNANTTPTTATISSTIATARPPSKSITSTSSGSSTFNPLARPPERPALSPTRTGGSNKSYSSTGHPKSPPGGVSSWSRKADEGSTAPAWNIHQYGYMGGASQGNQGISFGGRRQITSAGPSVPSLADKERKRRERAEEEERLRRQAEEAERRRRVEREAEEERARIDEEARWAEESRQQQEAKQRRLEEQKREWEEQERQWKLQEEQRQREEREAQERVEADMRRKRAGSDARLQGQFLSQYQAEQANKPRSRRNSHREEYSEEREHIRELERQLEEAKERERQYQQDRQVRLLDEKMRSRSKSRTRPPPSPSPSPPPPPPRAPSPQDSTVSWAQADDRDYLRKAGELIQRQPIRPLPNPTASLGTAPSSNPESSPPFTTLSSLPTRPLPEPSPSARPLPDTTIYTKQSQPLSQSRADRYLSTHPPSTTPTHKTHFAPELTSTSEARAEDARRFASQQKTKVLGLASRSLLEREMERERKRQQEWEEIQRNIQEAAKHGGVVEGTGTGTGTRTGGSWDSGNQHGYSDGNVLGGMGPGAGKRQIIGPRPFGGR